MGGFFSAPSAPAPAPAPELPPSDTASSAEAQAAADRERERMRKAAGRSSTILTSGLGDTSTATVEKKQLLGG